MDEKALCDYDKALACYEKALAIREAVLGKEHQTRKTLIHKVFPGLLSWDG